MRFPLFIILAMGSTPCAFAADVQVYLAAGQSNATIKWGESIQRTLRDEAESNKVLVVRSTHSGNAMWQWFNLGVPGQNYADDLAAVQAAMGAIATAGDTPKFKGIFWMQGEADSLSDESTAGYADRFNGMVERYRQDLELPESLAISIGLTDANPAPMYDDPAVLGTTRARVEAMRAVQVALGTGSLRSHTDSRGLARTDQWHLTEAGQTELGRQMALAMAKVQPLRETRPVIAPPAKVRAVAITEGESGEQALDLQWESRPGARYQLERSESLDELWAGTGTERVGTGNVMSHREAVSGPRMFYRITELEPFAPIHRIATVGDSITANSSQMLSVDGTYYWPGCWPAHLRTVVNHRLQYVSNPLSGMFTFAVNGAKSSNFMVGGGSRSYWEAALTSPADTLMVMLGANDIAPESGNVALTRNNIVALWDEARDSGKKVIGMEVVACRADHPSASFFAVRQKQLNSMLKEAALTRRIEFVECGDALDEDGDGFSDSGYLHDTIHPNMAGGMRLADHIAPWLSERLATNPLPVIPGPDDPAWVTTGSYPSGTGPKADGWTLQTAGNAVIQSRLVERTDGVIGYWQELDVSGMTEAGMRLSQPTDFIQLYTANWAPNLQPGEKLVMVAEVEMDDPFLALWSEMHVGWARTGDHLHAGNLGAPDAATPRAYKGFLLTEPWTYTGGTSSLAMLKAVGNGRLRVGRLGIYRVP